MNTTPQPKLIAYFNDPAIKAKYVARMEAHMAADDLIRGTFGDESGESGWRGCAVGCTFHVAHNPHVAAEAQIGVPRLLARLEDLLFERMPVTRHKAWPLQFLQAIPVGADLSNVWPQLAIWLLTDADHGVLRFAKTDSQKQAIQQVSDLYSRQAAGNAVSRAEWRTAAAAAYAAYAAAYAAYAAAAYAAAAYADDAAADAAAYADDAAADAADAAAYADDAAADGRKKHFCVIADKILELLAAAPLAP